MPELDAIERTAFLTAALRAAESCRDDRLYEDQYAAVLAGDTGRRLLEEIREATFPADGSARDLPSTPDYNAIRTRFFDDCLRRATADPEMKQVVLAPAGLDSRAYRLDWPVHVRLYEIDRPVVLAKKEELLGGVRPRVHRTVIGTDLITSRWENDLLAAGYDPGAPSTWLLEGLLYYLEEPDVHRLLNGVRALTAPGSLVAADLVNAAALTLPQMRGLLDIFLRWGCPWRFGTDDPEALFSRHEIAAEVVQPGEPAVHYGRWPDPVPPRAITDVRRVFLVHGRRR